MRKLIVSEFLTLDGVMEAPGGEPTHPHSGWTIDHHGPEQMQYKLDEVLEAEALLIGRKTYESFSEAWPKREGEFADKMNSMPKYVVSSTLTDPAWENTRVLSGDPAQETRRLKEGDGGPILVVGSATLVHALELANLIDEYRLMFFPVLLGSGIRLFPDDEHKTDLELADSATFPSGVVAQTYRRAA